MIFSNTVYKIRLWSSDKSSKVFVFVGNDIPKEIKEIFSKIESGGKLLMNDKKKLEKQFGVEYRTILGLNLSNNPIYLFNIINHDDNINIVTKKIIVYLHKYIKIIRPEDIYLWCHKNIVKDINIDYVFISNCFKKESKISFEYFKLCIHNYFGVNIKDSEFNMIDKQIALRLISTLKTDTVIEPILYKYIYDGFFEYIQYNPNLINPDNSNIDKIKTFTLSSYLSLILSSFEIKDNLLELITINDVSDTTLKSIYFPMYKNINKIDFNAIEKFIKQLDEIEKEINNYTLTHTYQTKTYITFLSLKGNDVNFNTKVHLSILFDKIHTNNSIIFAKYKSLNNIFYKIHKDSIIKIAPKDLEKWTTYKNGTGKIINNTYIVIKFKFGNHSWATLTLSDILGYDIKFNIGVDEKAIIEDVYLFYSKINSFIKSIKYLYPDASIPLITKDNLKIINLVTYNVIGLEKKTVKFDNIDKIITNKMYPYFNIIPNPDKNILHLQYKKVDNYVKYDNIQLFITQHFGMSKDNLIAKLMQVYVLSKEESEKEYDKWSNKNEVEFVTNGINKTDQKIKPKNDNFVNLKLKINEVIDTKFIITGLRDYHTQTVLSNLIEILLDLTNQKIKKNKIDITSFDEQMFNEQKTNNIVFNDIEKELDLSSDYNEDEVDDLDEIDAEFAALELEFKSEKQAATDIQKETEISSPAEKTKKGKAPGPILGFLKEADKKLFDYPSAEGKKRTDYPSSCGWTDTRQPMVISEAEKNKIDKEFPNGYDGYAKTGSTTELAKKNFYICPKVWCPKSRVAISYKDYQKNNNKCPYPEIDEEPVLFSKTFWGKDEASALNRKHYIGYLKDSTHPNHLCLPCCFKLPPSDKKKNQETCKTNFNIKNVVKTTAKDTDIIGNEKYIKAETYFPLEPSRLGLLPSELTELLGNKKCGSRHDGTGLLDNGTKCFLRKGINHSTHSFISCILSILDLPFTSDEKLLKFIINNIDIQKYLALENGKIIRLFINVHFDIYNVDNFKEFHKWFLEQPIYIKKYNLYKIKKTIENINPIVFDKSKFINTYKDIIREFMIYNSFKHFILYLKDDEVIKDHRTLLDLINTEHETINTQRIHIIIVDVDTKTNKTVFLCPFNRNVKQFININNPFIFVIKNNEYYEPLSYIEYSSGNITTQYEFLYENSDSNIQSIINYYINNCGSIQTEKTGESISVFLESIGYNTKSYVIDFSFRVKGILLKNHLFIPFKNKLDIYNVANNSFIYFNDITDFKCLLDEDTLINIFKEIQKFTKDDYYEITKFIVDNEDEEKIIALRLNTVLIPLILDKNNLLFRKFEDDLEIFIGTHIDDKRTQIMKTINENTQAFEVFFKSVTSFINNDEKIRNEITFLTDLQNPFPKNFRRKKLLDILEKISTQVIIKSNESLQNKVIINNICNNTTNTENCVYPCDIDNNSLWNTCLMGIPKEYMKKFVNKMIETLLLGRNINNIIKVFSINSGEVLLDQHDINNNKIQDLIEYQKNPFKLLSERLEDITDAYIFDKTNDIKSLSKIYVKENTIFNIIPGVWKNYLQDFKIIENNKYNSLYLYSLFININDAINPNKEISLDILKSIIKRRIIHDYTTDLINPIFENESLIKNIKELYKLSADKASLDIILNISDSITYFPSVYEVEIMADIVGINVVITGRKNKANPDGFDIVDKKSNYTIIINNNYDRINKLDQFKLFVKNKKIIILKKKDIPEDFNRLIENKKKIFEININSPI
jgi:hypothetical protein